MELSHLIQFSHIMQEEIISQDNLKLHAQCHIPINYLLINFPGDELISFICLLAVGRLIREE